MKRFTQKERILRDCNTIHRMSDRAYVGRPPAFHPVMEGPIVVGYQKHRAGVPFVKLQEGQ